MYLVLAIVSTTPRCLIPSLLYSINIGGMPLKSFEFTVLEVKTMMLKLDRHEFESS